MSASTEVNDTNTTKVWACICPNKFEGVCVCMRAIVLLGVCVGSVSSYGHESVSVFRCELSCDCSSTTEQSDESVPPSFLFLFPLSLPLSVCLFAVAVFSFSASLFCLSVSFPSPIELHTFVERIKDQVNLIKTCLKHLIIVPFRHHFQKILSFYFGSKQKIFPQQCQKPERIMFTKLSLPNKPNATMV